MREIRPRTPVQWLLVLAALLYAGVLLLAPIFAIVQKALANGLQPVLDSLSEANVLHALQVTFWMTIAAVIINTIMGVIIAWVLTRQKFPGKRLVNLLAAAKRGFAAHSARNIIPSNRSRFANHQRAASS